MSHTTILDLVCEDIQQAENGLEEPPVEKNRGLEELKPNKKEWSLKEPTLMKKKRLKWLMIMVMVMNRVMKQAFKIKLNYLFTKTLNTHETRIVHSRVTV
jgi:hypothetical protein